ncbi:MAG: ATP-dependent zinc metalloprotease FtsH [Alphaproteobacteria bacterium]|nr:ATP-dependent zinc metalloprotease FtsH [Alphaproteobacteria bacterium]
MTNWRRWLPLTALLLLLLALLALGGLDRKAPAVGEIPYSTFKSLIEKALVPDIRIEGSQVTGTLREPQPLGPAAAMVGRFRTRLPPIADPELMPLLERQKVAIDVADDGTDGWGRILASLLPWLLFLGVYAFLWRRLYTGVAGGLGQGGLGNFLDGSRTEETRPARKVTFADVAGQDNAKREVSELVEYLKEPARFQRLGAEVPHGILLMGPPGTGKTLLARALAGEAEVPFYSTSASEFIEVYVGVGASRVRRMFDEAKRRAPSIIFIDELDAVGRLRGSGFGGGHDEREQTLNQILAEMDGFAGHEAVIVLAATNRPDVLDPALLRPGRFDRHVTLDLPDRKAREEILQVHVRKVPLAADVNLSAVAAGTPGFSGADLKNLVNEAAIQAARESGEKVAARHFDDARDKIMMGTVRTLAIQPDEKHRLAVHEAGHTLAAFHLPTADPIHKVTIIPRGRALGMTQQLPEADRHTLPEDYLRDRLALMLAGRAAERELIGNVSSGADDDIRQATALARAMVGRWGMAKEVGPVDLRDGEEHPFLGREMALPRRFSERMADVVDDAVRRLLLEAEERSVAIIRANRAALERLVAALEEHELLEREAIARCLGAMPLAPVAAAG